MKELIKRQPNIDFLQESIKKFKMGGPTNGQMECAKANSELGTLLLKFLWASDQSKLFHWQTKINSHHVSLGEFYEEYIDELDELVESILGKVKEIPTVGMGTINLMDYSPANLNLYLSKVEMLFTEDFAKHFDKNSTENIGLYHTVGDILELISKLKYLLKQK